ncbi:hypothetical protein DFH29DRAFT_1076005 [Suillus ampliporus]|nr:hypothetical protein DFH29DRAFT_1076005 [Suillus ampliporus]
MNQLSSLGTPPSMPFQVWVHGEGPRINVNTNVNHYWRRGHTFLAAKDRTHLACCIAYSFDTQRQISTHTVNEWDSRAFELQVANYEPLDYGSGKLFQEAADGSKTSTQI